MDTNTQQQVATQSRTPTELLNAQTQSLAQLVEIQKAQMAEVRQQNDRMIKLLSQQFAAPAPEAASSLAHVKIEDVNMPFGAMVGFLIKVSLASIPAAIIIAIIYGIIIAILSVVFGALFGGFFTQLLSGLGY